MDRRCIEARFHPGNSEMKLKTWKRSSSVLPRLGSKIPHIVLTVLMAPYILSLTKKSRFGRAKRGYVERYRERGEVWSDAAGLVERKKRKNQRVYANTFA